MKRLSSLFAVAATGIVLLGSPHAAVAQWTINGTGICVQESLQYAVGVASDNAGGAIIVWYDCRSGSSNADIYAQRLDAAGIARWTAGGKAVGNGSGFQSAPHIVSDGGNGAYISWETGSVDVYAQHADSSGNLTWPSASGLTICALGNIQGEHWLASDNRRGALVAWSDRRSGVADIYVQRYDTSGTRWTGDGVLICGAMGYQHSPIVIGDGDGGAISCWQDHRTGSDVNETIDLYAQRVDSAGTVKWTLDGVAICTADSEQSDVTMAPDGAKGAIIAWKDKRSGYFRIYAQRVDSLGAVKWAANGVAVSQDTAERPWTIPDGRGGAILAWYDLRHSYNLPDIYAQRLTSTGAAAWTAGGIAVCGGTLYASLSTATTPVIGDGNGGAIITWQDYRNAGLQADIYAQKLDSLGARRWTANGVAVCSAANDQYFATLTTNGDSGAIVAWLDGRINPPPRWDIFAEGVTGAGVPLAVQFAYLTAAIEQGPHARIAWRTESECNSYQWQIERAPAEDGPYQLRGCVPAAGICTQPTEYSFQDDGLVIGQRYYYRLVEVSLEGRRSYYGPVSVGPVTIGAGDDRVVPLRNPFTNFAVLSGHESSPCLVYNAAGQVAERCTGARVGARLANGIYFVAVAGHDRPVKLLKLK